MSADSNARHETAVIPAYHTRMSVATASRNSESSTAGELRMSVVGGSLSLIACNKRADREGFAEIVIDPAHVDALIDALQDFRSSGLLRARQWDRATGSRNA